jgi:DNA (cytosine-5)-methyltransferase 1
MGMEAGGARMGEDVNYVDNSRALTHLSLCAGYGGIDLGLSRAFGDVRPVAYVEIEAFAVANLVAKMEAGELAPAPIWSDLKTLDWSLFCGRVDIISGGFPCQPFSSVGHRRGDDDPRHLWPYIARGIRIIKPAFVFLENVDGIISSRLKGDGWRDQAGTSVALHVLRELERMGYRAEAGSFSALEVGAPHQRKRVFFLAVQKDIKSPPPLRPEFIRRWPAGRGKARFDWEPPRTTLRDHKGRHG